jgi:hypothetical protein
MAAGVYSFLDTSGAITGPGGSAEIGSDAGVAAEGITIEYVDDKGVMTIGAAGDGMHSLKATKAALVTLRLLKTSPVNAVLNTMYNYQTTTSANYGQNQLHFNNSVRGDSIIISGAGFKKAPNVVYAVEGGLMEWTFNCINCDEILGGN